MDLAHTYLGEKALEQGIKYIVNKPMENLDKTIEWVEKIPMAPHHKDYVSGVKTFLENKDSNWYSWQSDC